MHFQAYSGTFNNMQLYSSILRDIKAYSGIIEASGPTMRQIRHILNFVQPLQIQSFRTLAYLEPKASPKTCHTCQMIRHIQSPGIVRTFYSRTFKDI